MTKAKKVLSLVLAVVMVAAMFAFSASAETVEGETRFSVTVDPTAPVNVGDKITVTVKLTTDYQVGPLCVPVYYDVAYFRFVENSVANKIALFGAGTDIQAHNDAEKGCVRVAFIPDPSKEVAAQVLTDATLFTFQLEAIANGTSDIGLHADDQKTETNKNGALYCGKYTSSDVTKDFAMYLTPFVIHNATATVGAAVEAKLVGKTGTVAGETSTGIVDEVNHYLYGIVPGGNIEDFFEMSDGSDLVIALGSATAMNGTGATVTVGDTVYTLVVFGDVDGDGAISGTDALKVEQHVGGNANAIPTVAGVYATDADNDTFPSGTDALKIEQYVGGNHSAVIQSR